VGAVIEGITEQKQDKYFPNDFSKSCLLQSMVTQQLRDKVFFMKCANGTIEVTKQVGQFIS
jgi:hypothetical protein